MYKWIANHSSFCQFETILKSVYFELILRYKPASNIKSTFLLVLLLFKLMCTLSQGIEESLTSKSSDQCSLQMFISNFHSQAQFRSGVRLRELKSKWKNLIVSPQSVRGCIREWVNTESVWEFKHGFVKAVVTRAVHFRRVSVKRASPVYTQYWLERIHTNFQFTDLMEWNRSHFKEHQGIPLRNQWSCYLIWLAMFCSLYGNRRANINGTHNRKQ